MKSFLNIGILILACIALVIVNYNVGGWEMAADGFKKGYKFLLRIMPMIIVFTVLAGQIEAFYAKKPNAIRSVTTGNAGILKAAVAGTLFPGGTSVGPVLKSEWANGGSKMAIIAFMISMNLINWNIMLFRMPFFGEKITAWIYGIGIAIVGVSVFIMTIIQYFHSRGTC